MGLLITLVQKNPVLCQRKAGMYRDRLLIILYNDEPWIFYLRTIITVLLIIYQNNDLL